MNYNASFKEIFAENRIKFVITGFIILAVLIFMVFFRTDELRLGAFDPGEHHVIEPILLEGSYAKF